MLIDLFVQKEGVHGAFVKPKITLPILFFVLILGTFITAIIISLPQLFLNPMSVFDILLGVFSISLIILYGTLLINKKLFNGPPYVRTNPKTLNRMLELAEIKPGELTVDLGSGDGELVIACAKAGANAYGYEINPLLFIWSNARIKKHGVDKNTYISKNSFWNVNFADFDVVTVFGISYMMPALEKKLQKELKKGSRVVSNSFKFPNWDYRKQDMDVYLYIKD